ncbi:MAG: hypothetical protein AAGI90_00215 [Chlamydiota bacterium]
MILWAIDSVFAILCANISGIQTTYSRCNGFFEKEGACYAKFLEQMTQL